MLRPDATGTDLVFIQVGLNAIMNRAGEVSPDLHRRYLHLVLEACGPETTTHRCPCLPSAPKTPTLPRGDR